MSPLNYRSATIDRAAVKDESRTVELAFSSEAPVERYGFREVLDHSEQAIDLSRLNSGGALLSEHDTNRQIGVVERAYIGADRVARAVVRFSRSALGEQEFQDVKDGIRRLVSVGYRIHDFKEERSGNVVTQRVNRWEPLEISLVSVPADASVGVGRNQQMEDTKSKPMSTETAATINSPAAAPVADSAAFRAAIVNEANKRASEILSIGALTGFRDEAISFVQDGKTVEAFRGYVLEKQAEKIRTISAPSQPNLGLSDKERKGYSLIRAINAAARNNWSDAGFELEASRAIEKQLGKEARSFFVPSEIFTRELTVAAPTSAGNLVKTEYSSDFISLLRNKLYVSQLGARVLSGLVGDVQFNKQTGGSTTYWLGESDNVTASDITTGTFTMSPKTIAAKAQISRKLMKQTSPAVDGLVREDIINSIATGIDLAALAGTGASNQPTGLLNIAGTTTVALGTNGAAPTRDSIIALINAIELANADAGSMGFISNPKMKSKLLRTPMQAGGVEGNFLMTGMGDALMGYRFLSTNQVPSNLVKGTSGAVCSALIFGNFNDMLIGNWGVLDLQVDPYGSADDGGLIIRAFQDVDINVRNAASFSIIKDALTT